MPRMTWSPARQLHCLLYSDFCRSPISRTLSPPAVQPRHSCRQEVSGVIDFPLPFRPYDWLMPPHFRIRAMAGSFPPREPAPSPNAFTAALHVVPSSPPLVENFCKAEMNHPPLSTLRPAGQPLLTQWKHQHVTSTKGIFHQPRAKVMNGRFLGFEWADLPSFRRSVGERV